MPAYYIGEHIVTNPVKFEEYRVKSPPTVAMYGGRYLTKIGSHKFLESPHWKPGRVLILEFPSIDQLNAWYTSAEYKPLIALRQASTDDKRMIIAVEGV